MLIVLLLNLIVLFVAMLFAVEKVVVGKLGLLSSTLLDVVDGVVDPSDG